MHAVIRSYSGQGATELFEELAQREEDARQVVATIPGFVSYVAIRSDSGGSVVTVFEDREGTDESTRRAAEWVKANIGVDVDPPTITQGEAILHF
jgi:heme-degrading monooxygenase HmoA